jgi:hypothetical protein
MNATRLRRIHPPAAIAAHLATRLQVHPSGLGFGGFPGLGAFFSPEVLRFSEGRSGVRRREKMPRRAR